MAASHNNEKYGWKRFVFETVPLASLAVSLILGVVQLKHNANESRYRYLTGVWNDITKTSIDYPQFQDKTKTSIYTMAFTEDELRQYDSYVRWIGGFLEDLYVNDYERHGYLYYNPWIDTVLDAHSTWFIAHIEYYKHTPKLYKRISRIN